MSWNRLFLAILLCGMPAQFTQAVPWTEDYVFSQVGGDRWSELQGIVAIADDLSLSDYEIETIGRSNFELLFSMSPDSFGDMNLSDKRDALVAAIDEARVRSSSTVSGLFDVLTARYESYLRFVAEHRSRLSLQRYGGDDLDSRTRRFLRSYWIMLEGPFKGKIKPDESLTFDAAMRSLSDEPTLQQRFVDLLDVPMMLPRVSGLDDYQSKRKLYLEREAKRRGIDPFQLERQKRTAPDHSMRFRHATVPDLIGITEIPGWISAEGRITKETVSDFKEFIETARTEKSSDFDGITLILNSTGGDLNAALELGRLIRQFGFSTAVGATDWAGAEPRVQRGACLSACAYAFLGGVTRRAEGWYRDDRELFLNQDGEFGVHQFAPTNRGYSPEDIQLRSALIVQYLLDMGVDAKLFVLASDRSVVKVLDKKTLRELQVITNAGFSYWSIDALGQGMAASSISDDSNENLNQMATYCMSDPQGNYLELSISSLVRDQARMVFADLDAWTLRFGEERIFVPADLTHKSDARVALTLSRKQLLRILNSGAQRLYIDATSEGKPVRDFSTHTTITDQSRRRIVWSMKNCIN